MGAMNLDINTRNVPAGKQRAPPPPSTDSMTSWANIVQLGAPKKLPEERTKEMNTVKEDTNKINSIEEDGQLAGEETSRGREKSRPPRESWTAFIDEENSRELEIHRHQEITRMDTESIAGSAEGKGERGRVNEGSDTEQVREDERIDIDDDEKTQDRNAYKPDDESTGIEEETNPHDEDENIEQRQRSPKRIKKLKTDREAHTSRERTRSKTKTRITQRL